MVLVQGLIAGYQGIPIFDGLDSGSSSIPGESIFSAGAEVLTRKQQKKGCEEMIAHFFTGLFERMEDAGRGTQAAADGWRLAAVSIYPSLFPDFIRQLPDIFHRDICPGSRLFHRHAVFQHVHQ